MSLFSRRQQKVRQQHQLKVPRFHDNKGDAAVVRNFTFVLDKAKVHKGSIVSLELFFTDKWIMVSEVGLATSKDLTDSAVEAVPKADKKTKIVEDEYEEEEYFVAVAKDNDNKDQVMTVVLPDQNLKNPVKKAKYFELPAPATSPPPPSERKSSDDDDNNNDQNKSDNEVNANADVGGTSTIYVGLVIGVLGVTVLLLLATILIMLKRNKQKVFSKHQKHQQRLQQLHGGGGGGSVMRHLTPMSFVKSPEYMTPAAAAAMDSMTLASSSKLYEDAALINRGAAASEDIYHEPSYPRLVLQRPQTTFR